MSARPGVRAVRVGTRLVGPGEPCLIVAEAGVNHNGDLGLALRMVDAAADAGACAVKFQTFVADRLASAEAPTAAYQRGSAAARKFQREMLHRLELSQTAYRTLSERCRQRGVLFLSTPFDEESADILDEVGVPAFKVASGELTNLPLLEHIAAKGKPVILSTGMAYLSEVDEAVRVLRGAGAAELILLHCVSAYPAEPAEANLRAMRVLECAFGTPVGFSDHTLGAEVAIAAVALGAAMVEKHFTLDRELPGPDHRVSLEPAEMGALVRAIRTVESALGTGEKRPMPGERETRRVARRSLHLRIAVDAGTVVTPELLVALRPGGAIGPEHRHLVLGRRLRRSRPAGAPLRWEDLE